MKPSLRMLAPILTLALFPLAGAAQVDLGWEVERTLFPPELVWENREAISLDWEQQKQMTEAIAGVRARAAELEAGIWQSTIALAETLDSDWINADEALTHAEWIFGQEQQVKTLHLQLLIQVKNILTAEQEQLLTEIRARATGSSGGG